MPKKAACAKGTGDHDSAEAGGFANMLYAHGRPTLAKVGSHPTCNGIRLCGCIQLFAFWPGAVRSGGPADGCWNRPRGIRSRGLHFGFRRCKLNRLFSQAGQEMEAKEPAKRAKKGAADRAKANEPVGGTPPALQVLSAGSIYISRGPISYDIALI